MDYGITIKDLADTLNDAIKDSPALEDYIIDSFDTVRIEGNGFYLIKLYAYGYNGQSCTITKCLRPSNWRGENE